MNATRGDAYNLLCEWVQSESLRKHCLAVEAAVRGYAPRYGGDVELWGVTGLLHDFDYERHPSYALEPEQTGHPFEGVKHLRSLGYPEEICRAILGHALYSGVPRDSDLARVLFACDELAGFTVACARMRPDGLASLTPESVQKKLKDKKFAAGVSRDDVALGVTEMLLPAPEHYANVIEFLKPAAADLGLPS